MLYVTTLTLSAGWVNLARKESGTNAVTYASVSEDLKESIQGSFPREGDERINFMTFIQEKAGDNAYHGVKGMLADGDTVEDIVANINERTVIECNLYTHVIIT